MTADLLFFPALIVIAGACILPLVSREIRPALFLLFPLGALASIWAMPEDFAIRLAFASYEILPVQANPLGSIFATIFAVVAGVGGIYAFHNKNLGEQVAALIYSGSAMGVAFAGDLLSLIIFWEVMAVSSTWLIWARRTEESQHAGMRYLLVHAFGGVILMSGILMHLHETGSLLVTALPADWSLSSVLILFGVSVNAAVPPLHAWLTDAYPKATLTGAVFMCAFTTKAAVFVMLRLFPGWEILIWLGVVMAIYGLVFALLADDIRVILAYSIVSQVGYMVTAAGIGTEMALNGASVHAFSHILYKSLLFMAAGAIIYATGKSRLSELGGLAGKLRPLLILYMIGAFSISGLPLFNGFISKSIIIDAAGTAHYETAALLLILASAGTFLYAGLKIPYYTWFSQPKSEITVRPIPVNMKIAMGIAAFFCILFGIFPGLLYSQLPWALDYEPYSIYHLVETSQIMIFTFVGFWLFRKSLAPQRKIVLDTDWFYRKPASFVRKIFVNSIDDFFGAAERMVNRMVAGVAKNFDNPMRWLNPFSQKDLNARSYSSPVEATLGFAILTFAIVGILLML